MQLQKHFKEAKIQNAVRSVETAYGLCNLTYLSYPI